MDQLTEDSFEQAIEIFLGSSVIDLRKMKFIDPFGMIAILELGEFLKAEAVQAKNLRLPESEEVLKYLERMDFFKFAGRYFILDPAIKPVKIKYLRSSESDVLLEITPIEKSDDIHFIVGRVKDRAQWILQRHLHYDERAINGFIVALSEVCQNIVEHSEYRGFVGIQKYHWKIMEKNIVKIAVMDIGMGFRKSLSERFPFSSDIEAIDMALLKGVSRHADEGRGHGLVAVRKFIEECDGMLTLRSGTAKRYLNAMFGRRKKRSDLTFFPGAQISIILPEV
ncbi:MAG: ATP-binding protein [Nitrospiraceae bacterium]|nr:ATP-binding protein [Nitrospiraceae bacterium]